MGSDCQWVEGFLLGNERVLKLIVVMTVALFCEYTKNPLNYTF